MTDYLTPDRILATRREIVADEKIVLQATERLTKNKALFNAMLMVIPEAERAKYLSADLGMEEAYDLFGPRAGENKQAPPARMAPERQSRQATGSSSAKKAASLTSLLKDIAEKAGTNGITHREIMDQVLETEFADRVKLNGAKNYYNMVGKLFNRNILAKSNDRIYLKAYLDKLEAAGLIQSEPAGKPANALELSMQIIRKFPDGLTGAQLRDHLIASELAPPSLKKHSQYVYNTLGTLVGTGRVIKEGRIYKAAETAKPPRRNGEAS